MASLDTAAEVRVSKRQKLSPANALHQRASKSHASKIFAPYRTIGLVSPTAVPFTSIPLGKTTFQITTSVGRSLQTYDLRRGLNLVFITRPQTPGPITASAAWKDKVFAAWACNAGGRGSGVWVFKRGKKETELEVPQGEGNAIKSFCVFGGWIIGVCENSLLVWKAESFELYTTLRGVSPLPFTGCATSLPTFLNKIAAARADGSVEIWNIASGKLVYSVLPPSTAYGAVTALESTPALSLVAIAYERGPILIHDIRADQTVMQFNAPQGLPVNSISFRTDDLGAGEDGQKAGVMATSSSLSGDITLWDLNNGGRKSGVLRSAHVSPSSLVAGGISKIEFLPGQAVLVSSGLDNSLKTWIFDQTPFSPIPRILHQRSGHSGHITRLQFLPTASDGSDDTGKWLMSSSTDRRLWGWSLRRDGQSTELSQGAVQKKAKKQGLMSVENQKGFEDLLCPPITSIACSLNRDGGIGAVPGKHPIWQGAKGKKMDAEISAMTGWESVITSHSGDNKARTWFWGRKRAGRWAFETSDGRPVTSVAMSPCGTFAVVGSSQGAVDTFNLQSGLLRQRFPARLTAAQAKQLSVDIQRTGLVEEVGNDGKRTKFLRGQGKHEAAVVGLAVDNLNKTIISADADGVVKFWDFQTGLLRSQLQWSVAIEQMKLQRGSNLAAFACADNCVRVVDISTQRVIRELWPSREPLAALQGLKLGDFAFSNDGHWIAASLGQVILLWDLPTGHLIDAFKLTSNCTSLAFSPTGEFLATATHDSVGVDVWSNRSLYTSVSTRHVTPTELSDIYAGASTAPTTSGENGAQLIGATPDSNTELVGDDLALLTEDASVADLQSDLLSLSLVPRSRWQNLLHMDLIRARNKPSEAPKKPEKAPFFLPSTSAIEKGASTRPSSELADTTAAELAKEKSRMLKLARAGETSEFTRLLLSSSNHGDFAPFLSHLSSLSPAAADVQIRSLSLMSAHAFEDDSIGSSEGSELVLFIRALTSLMHQRRDFELAQAWMSVFLRVHGDVVAADGGQLRQSVRQFADALKEERKRVKTTAEYCAGVVGYLRAARV